VGVALTSEFTSEGWPGEVRSLLGEGVFLVIAWVGLWYPLDALFFARRPLLLERKVLQLLMESEVTLERAQTLSPTFGPKRGSAATSESM
jgi:type II secretory pathway component PulM